MSEVARREIPGNEREIKSPRQILEGKVFDEDGEMVYGERGDLINFFNALGEYAKINGKLVDEKGNEDESGRYYLIEEGGMNLRFKKNQTGNDEGSYDIYIQGMRDDKQGSKVMLIYHGGFVFNEKDLIEEAKKGLEFLVKQLAEKHKNDPN